MKTKFYLSTLTLLIFAILGGGSIEDDDIVIFIKVFLVVAIVVGIIVLISSYVKGKNKNKRLRMIKEDEENSTDFDRSVFIGDDRCKIYFDSKKKQVMIMRVMTEGITKEYVEDFEFPGKSLALYKDSEFYIYDATRRKFLTGSFNDLCIEHEVTSIADKDKNKDVPVNNTILPTLTKHVVANNSGIFSPLNKTYPILIEENRGLIAISESGKVKDVFNYINASSLPKKVGSKTTVNLKGVGDYFFIMDDFFKVLVIIEPGKHKVFNYSDIIEVSYIENGNQIFTKSTGRTVGGAVVGGVLMGGAGAVVGGLSGASKQNKEVKDMDIKILLRSTSTSSYVLHFNNSKQVLKTKDDTDRRLYETYLKNANQAKDLLSVIIDNAKQTSTPTIQQIVQPVSTSASSVADEIAKLAKLRAEGILTEEEFQAQKSKLLGL